MPKPVSERIYIDHFLRAKGWSVPEDDIVPSVPPAPDFVLRLPDGRQLGIEVTELAADDGKRVRGGSRMREDESFGSRWITDLANAYYDAGGVTITLQVNLHYTHPTRDPVPTPELRDRFLPLIHAAAQRLGPLDSERLEVRDDDESLGAVLHVHRRPDELGRYSRWKLLNHRIGFVRTHTPAQMQATIDEKAKHLPDYRTAAQDIALLIVANHFFRSGMVVFDGTVEARGFESVHLLHYPDGEVQKLA